MRGQAIDSGMTWTTAVLTAMLLVSFPGGSALGQDATPGSSSSQAGQLDVPGASFLPADTVAYLELRGDLPADQAEALRQSLAHFPGLDELPVIETAIDEVLEGLLADVTEGAYSWTEDVRPWFGGRVSAGLLDVASTVSGDPSLLAGLQVTDPASAADFVERVAGQAAGDVSGASIEGTHAGVPIVSGTDDAWAYAIVDDLLLLGTGADEVRTGIDVVTGTSPALASEPGFRDAFAVVPEGRLVAGWLDVDAFRWLLQAAMLMSADTAGVETGALLDALPLDLTMYVAARSDGAILQAFATPGEGTPSISQGVPHLADAFPVGTALFFEVPQVGSTIASSADWLVELLPTSADDEATVGLLVTGIENLLGWVGDIAIGGGMDDGGVWFGAVMEGASDGAADPYLGLVQLIFGAAALGPAIDPSAADPGVDLSVEDVDGVTVMTVSIDALDAGGAPVFVEPSISLARDGDRLLLGTPAWVAQALDADPAASLAEDGGYQDAIVAAGSPDAGHLYVDIGAIREAVEPILALTMPEYAEIAPWLEPVDRAIVGYGVTEEGVTSSTVLLVLE